MLSLICHFGRSKNWKPCCIYVLLFCHFQSVKIGKPRCGWIPEFASARVTNEGYDPKMNESHLPLSRLNPNLTLHNNIWVQRQISCHSAEPSAFSFIEDNCSARLCMLLSSSCSSENKIIPRLLSNPELVIHTPVVASDGSLSPWIILSMCFESTYTTWSFSCTLPLPSIYSRRHFA